MELNRKPTSQELMLIEFHVKKAKIKLPDDWKEKLSVLPMDDGSMGSLRLFPDGKIVEGRTFGEQVSDLQFTDSDDIEVIASLNLDKKGRLFELDIWKTNFSRLIKFPEIY